MNCLTKERYKVLRATKENVEVIGFKLCSAVFGKSSGSGNIPLEEMFPISSDSVPEKEKPKAL